MWCGFPVLRCKQHQRTALCTQRWGLSGTTAESWMTCCWFGYDTILGQLNTFWNSLSRLQNGAADHYQEMTLKSMTRDWPKSNVLYIINQSSNNCCIFQCHLFQCHILATLFGPSSSARSVIGPGTHECQCKFQKVTKSYCQGLRFSNPASRGDTNSLKSQTPVVYILKSPWRGEKPLFEQLLAVFCILQ